MNVSPGKEDVLDHPNVHRLVQDGREIILVGTAHVSRDSAELVERVIDQATRRVLQVESVPAQEKVASLWEPHTQILRRSKPQPHETEFGHKVNYADTCPALRLVQAGEGLYAPS